MWYADRVSEQLSNGIAPLNWTIWNLFMPGVLLKDQDLTYFVTFNRQNFRR